MNLVLATTDAARARVTARKELRERLWRPAVIKPPEPEPTPHPPEPTPHPPEPQQIPITSSDKPREIVTIKRDGAFAPPATLVMRVVAEYYGTTVVHITSERRARVHVGPRHVAMYLCTELTGLSLPAIGRQMGGFNHTTILHARDKIAKLLLWDWIFADEIWMIRKRIDKLYGGDNAS